MLIIINRSFKVSLDTKTFMNMITSTNDLFQGSLNYTENSEARHSKNTDQIEGAFSTLKLLYAMATGDFTIVTVKAIETYIFLPVLFFVSLFKVEDL